MFFIPGVVISVITFPGVIMHELAHQIFCRLRNIPVLEVKYFQVKNPSGYVIHEQSDNPFTNFIISIGPFIVNTLIGALVLLPASIELSEFGLLNSIKNNNIGSDATVRLLPMLLAYWLGVSILMHAFPSTGDAKGLVSSILKNKDVSIFVKILVSPVVGLIYIGAFGSFVWLDLGYALLVAFLLPKFVGLFF